MAGRYTFWKLINERKIEIPVIQRDYAQGRDSAESVRNEFLSSIIDALDNPEKQLDMNFVYGTIDERNRFVPIDGQQRLTTLFLLHLYLIQVTCQDLSAYSQMKGFSYATRMSSRYFCDSITSNRIILSNDSDFSTVEKISEAIIDNNWFVTSWRNDPTVDAMLNMLDSIHNNFKTRNDLDHLLNMLIQDEDQCPLYFYYLDLGEYHLEDSIYIKMNARGKALTDYENFKAKLEKFLKDKNVLDWEEMAGALDREWTDLFWSLISADEKNKGKDISFDDKLMNFIVVYIFNEFANYTVETKREILRKQISDLFAMSKVKFTGEFSSFSEQFADENRSHKIEDSFVEMFKIFNLMVQNKQFIEYVPGKSICRDIFLDVINENITLETRVRFYAYCQFLLKHEKDLYHESIPNKLSEWLRVVEHLIGGQTFNGLEDYVHSIKGFHWLADNSDDIVGYLSEVGRMLDSVPDTEETDDAFPFFNKYIIREECLKAQLMKLSAEWDQAIRQTESNEYLNGQIYAVLEFAGITEENEFPGDWDSEKRVSYFEKYRKYADIMCALFIPHGDKSGDPGLDWRIGNVFRRALLTKGDFTLRYSRNSSFLVNSVDQYPYSWKRLLRPQRDKDINDKRAYLRELLADIDINDIRGSCEKVISDYHCNDLDRKYFIEIPEVMDYVIGDTDYYKKKQCLNFYRNDYEYKTKFLLGTTQLNGYNMDYYKYALLCELRKLDLMRVKYTYRSSALETVNEPIIIEAEDNAIYKINLIRETKQYQITGGRYPEEGKIMDTVEDMVQLVKDEGLL